MIGNVLQMLKSQLNMHFDLLVPVASNGAREETVVFANIDQNTDTVSLKTGAVNVLLYHIEHEKTLQPNDPYIRKSSDGLKSKAQPDVRINLYLLLVAKYKDYELGLHYLSQVIKFFQSHGYFDRQNTPSLGNEVGEIFLDSVPLSLKDQYDLFSMLRVSYYPAVAYRARTIVFRDDDSIPAGLVAEQPDRRLMSINAD